MIFSVRDELLPTCTLPKLRLDGLAVREPGVTPVPLNAMFSVGLLALLMIARFPLAAPAEVGAKVTVADLLCPAARVKGSASVPRLNPVPEMVACETVTFDPPELVIFTLRLWLLPVCTVPKSRLAGAAVSEPCAMPVPDRGIFNVDDPLTTAMLPLTAPRD